VNNTRKSLHVLLTVEDATAEEAAAVLEIMAMVARRVNDRFNLSTSLSLPMPEDVRLHDAPIPMQNAPNPKGSN